MKGILQVNKMIRLNERLDGIGAEMNIPAGFSRSLCSGLKAAFYHDLGFLRSSPMRSFIHQDGLSAALNFERDLQLRGGSGVDALRPIHCEGAVRTKRRCRT